MLLNNIIFQINQLIEQIVFLLTLDSQILQTSIQTIQLF